MQEEFVNIKEVYQDNDIKNFNNELKEYLVFITAGAYIVQLVI